MLNSKFNNYNLYILVLGKKTLVKFIIEIPAVKMYNFKKRILILHTNRYLCQIQAIFSIKYDFFLFKCEVCNLKLKLVLEVSMQRKQREERPNTRKKKLLRAALMSENYKTYLPLSFFVDFLLFCYLEIESQTILDYSEVSGFTSLFIIQNLARNLDVLFLF